MLSQRRTLEPSPFSPVVSPLGYRAMGLMQIIIMTLIFLLTLPDAKVSLARIKQPL
jgi:hypothetical protein